MSETGTGRGGRRTGAGRRRGLRAPRGKGAPPGPRSLVLVLDDVEAQALGELQAGLEEDGARVGDRLVRGPADSLRWVLVELTRLGPGRSS